MQDAREVRTKFSKTFTTWFFPVGEDVRRIVVDWVGYLDTLQLFGPVDPLFSATKIVISITCSRRAGSRARIGPMPRRSGLSSRRLSPAPG